MKKPKVDNSKNLIQNTKISKNGYMSEATQRKVKRIITNLVNCIRISADGKREATFVTLTLSAKQMHDDKFIKENMLKAFIKLVKRHTETKNYVWRAEPQKNGNIHFHILCDSRIEWQKVRGYWNRIQNINGYIEAYRKNQKAKFKNGFQLNPIITNSSNRRIQYQRDLKKGKTKRTYQSYDFIKQYEAYKYGIDSNYKNPNSTDIHAIKKVKNTAAYICKYMSKNEQNSRIIKGRIWGSSKAIKNLEYFTETLAIHDFEVSHSNPTVTGFLDLIENHKDVQLNIGDYHQLYVSSSTIEKHLKNNSYPLYASYKKHYTQMYNSLY